MPTMTAPWNRLPRPKPLILGAVIASLACLVALALNREARIGSSPATAQRTAEPRRPALTAAEEQHIRDLWPIHGDVERSPMRMRLGRIFYTTQNLSRAELGTRVKEALASYQAAEHR